MVFYRYACGAQSFFGLPVSVATEDVKQEAENDDAPVVDGAVEQGDGGGRGGIQAQLSRHDHQPRLGES
jgi:hypothetical protein